MFRWCVVHHLELALKDSLKGTSFDNADELILRIYQLYKGSLKKLWQLKDILKFIASHLNLQREDANQKRHLDQLLTVKQFLENIKEEEDGSFTYQDIKLENFERGKEISCCVKNEWISKIAGAIENRLGKQDSVISKHVVQVINTEGWFCVTDDSDFLYDEIEAPYNFFKSPLENAEHMGNVSTISEQFNARIKYALQYLDISCRGRCQTVTCATKFFKLCQTIQNEEKHNFRGVEIK